MKAIDLTNRKIESKNYSKSQDLQRLFFNPKMTEQLLKTNWLGNGWAIIQIKNPNYIIVRVLVRVIGLEPTHLAAPDPKSGVSTNFTIPAVDL